MGRISKKKFNVAVTGQFSNNFLMKLAYHNCLHNVFSYNVKMTFNWSTFQTKRRLGLITAAGDVKCTKVSSSEFNLLCSTLQLLKKEKRKFEFS